MSQDDNYIYIYVVCLGLIFFELGTCSFLELFFVWESVDEFVGFCWWKYAMGNVDEVNLWGNVYMSWEMLTKLDWCWWIHVDIPYMLSLIFHGNCSYGRMLQDIPTGPYLWGERRHLLTCPRGNVSFDVLSQQHSHKKPNDPIASNCHIEQEHLFPSNLLLGSPCN